MLCFTASGSRQIVPGIAIETAGHDRPYVRAGRRLLHLHDDLILAGGSVLGPGGRLLHADVRRAPHDDQILEMVLETEAANASALVLWKIPFAYNFREPGADEIILVSHSADPSSRSYTRETTLIVTMPIGSTIGFSDVVMVKKAPRAPSGLTERIFGVTPEYEKVKRDYRPMAAFDGQRLSFTKEWLSRSPD